MSKLLDLQGDPWLANIQKIEEKVGKIQDFVSKKSLTAALTIQEILDVKSTQSTMKVLPQPMKWFKLQDHVTDASTSRDLCRIRSGASGLGNRFRNDYSEVYNHCPA